MNFILRDSLPKYEIFEWFLLILPCYLSDMCPIFAWYPGKMFRAFEVKCRPIFETPADLLHIFATRHYCHLYQSKQHHHNNHHHQNNKHNHQNNKHHQNTTTTATTTKTQPPSQKTLKLWDPETLRHWEPDTDRRGHLMWKKFAAVGWMGSVAQCTSLVTGETRLVPAKAAAGLQKGSQPFLLWIHSMRKCESEKGKIVEINGCERAGNASNILHHCCGSINFSRKKRKKSISKCRHNCPICSASLLKHFANTFVALTWPTLGQRLQRHFRIYCIFILHTKQWGLSVKNQRLTLFVQFNCRSHPINALHFFASTAYHEVKAEVLQKFADAKSYSHCNVFTSLPVASWKFLLKIKHYSLRIQCTLQCAW